MKKHDLSKSKITLFEQCPKRLWLSVNRPDLIEIDDATQARFDTGHAVGELACDLVDGGVMVTMDDGVSGALEQTRELIDSGNRPIFEGTFQHKGVLVRVDIMRPDGKGGWHVAEVKSTASRKDYQLADLATQVWVLRGAGITISSASIRHIDTSFVYARADAYFGMFKDRVSDKDILSIVATREPVVTAARNTLQGSEPDIKPGAQCNDPFNCDFQDHCNKGIKQPVWPVSLLPRTGKKLAQQYEKVGVQELPQIAAGKLKSSLHERIRVATVSGIPFHDPGLAREMTRDWTYPRTYLDFETMNPAIPRWLGTKPYQQVPFQFSAHIEAIDGKIEHCDFLTLDGSDPRPGFVKALLKSVPAEGAIVTYNAAFERTRIKELVYRFPEAANGLKAMIGRIVDLEPVARACWYHRDQMGSWSIKAVLPTISGLIGYSDLAVQDGMEAQRAYFEALSEPEGSERRKTLDESLRQYCGVDTSAMIEVLRYLVGRPASI